MAPPILPLVRTLRNETCVVTAVRQADFSAMTLNREHVYFPISDVSDCDLPLMKPDAVFNWITGYRITNTGRKSRISELRFERSPTHEDSESIESSV